MNTEAVVGIFLMLASLVAGLGYLAYKRDWFLLSIILGIYVFFAGAAVAITSVQ